MRRNKRPKRKRRLIKQHSRRIWSFSYLAIVQTIQLLDFDPEQKIFCFFGTVIRKKLFEKWQKLTKKNEKGKKETKKQGVESSMAYFEVLGLGLEGQVLVLCLEASSPRKLPCSRLEDSTIFCTVEVWLKNARNLAENLQRPFLFSAIRDRLKIFIIIIINGQRCKRIYYRKVKSTCTLRRPHLSPMQL